MNSRRRRIRIIVCRIGAAAFLCAAAGVPAQGVYKQVDAGGHTTYTDQPYTMPSPRTTTVPAQDVANALAGSSAILSRRAVMIDANEAARRLEQAELERKQGAIRLPGEQVHNNDADLANHRYRQRQDELQRVVEQARHRSIETGRLLRAYP